MKKKIKLKKGKNRKRRVEKEKVNSDWLVISKRENLNRETSFEWNIKWNLRLTLIGKSWKTHPNICRNFSFPDRELDGFDFRWLEKSVTEIGKVGSVPFIFNHLKRNFS